MGYRTAGLLAAALCLTAFDAGRAQDEPPNEGERDMSAVQCVRVTDIDGIDIANDQTLIFRMRGDELYRNELPHSCPGMRRNDTLMYRTSVGRLCNVDIITVLEDWGFGFAPGASCGLGMFHPITEEIADELMEAGD